MYRKIGLAILFVPFGVLADLSAAAAQARDQGATTIEEIVVTARRREEDVQDVPMVVQAVSSEEAERNGLDGTMDLKNYVPGLEIRRPIGVSNFQVALRGVGLNSFTSGSGSTVAFYVDDMYLVSNGQLLFTAFDLDRIEVSKGPQGTLYGRNTTAGLIHYHTAAPTFDRDHYVTVEAGNYGLGSIEGMLNIPVTDTLATRFSGKYETFDGYQKNTLVGKKIGGHKQYTLRGQALWESDRSSVRVKGEYFNSDGRLRVPESVGTLDPDSPTNTTVFCEPYNDAVASGKLTNDIIARMRTECQDRTGSIKTDPDPYNQAFSSTIGGPTPQLDTQSVTFAVNASIDLDNATLTSISSFNRTKKEADDVETTLCPTCVEYNEFFILDDISQFSQELRLASSGDGRLFWQAGGYFDYYTIQNDFDGYVFGNILDDLGFGVTVPERGQLMVMRSNQKSLSAAAFGELEWSVTDRLSLLAGLRYTYQKQDFQGQNEEVNRNGSCIYSILQPDDAQIDDDCVPGQLDQRIMLARFDGSKTDNEPSWLAGVTFHITDDSMLYATARQGFKSGGFAVFFLTQSLQFTGPDPEKLLAYEIGSKNMFFDGRVRLNATGFYYDYKDFQTFVSVPIGFQVVQTIGNAGDAEVKGVEGEIDFQITESLRIGGRGAYVDAKATSGDFDGNRLANAPKWSGNAYAALDKNMGSWSLFGMVDVSYSSDQWANIDNAFQRYDPALTLWNISAGVVLDSGWEVSGYVRNLDDKLDRQGGSRFTSGGVLFSLWEQPRTYGLRVTYRAAR